LGRLANHLQSRTKETKINDSNIEHIYPQSPKEIEWGGRGNQETLSQYLWHIGNLTMLGRRLNREAANSEFEIKRRHYEGKSELLMAKEIAKSYDKWDENTIKDRAKRLAKLAVEVWDFDNPSRV